jgi:hypothetical protein
MTILGYEIPIFFVGMFGSIVIEVAAIVKCYHKEQPFPDRFRQKGFYFWQFIISLVGGSLVVAYDITNPVLAMQVGASAPTILLAMARTDHAHADRPTTCP